MVVRFANTGDSKHRLDADLIGSGRAWISTNGRTIEGTWKKSGTTKPTRFYDRAGNPVTLTAGQTFIQVVPSARDVRIKAGNEEPPEPRARTDRHARTDAGGRYHRSLMSDPLLSVIVPAWQSAATIERAIASALDDAPVDVECVVVDDGSTDGTADVVARLAAADPRIRLVASPVERAASRRRATSPWPRSAGGGCCSSMPTTGSRPGPSPRSWRRPRTRPSAR